MGELRALEQTLVDGRDAIDPSVNARLTQMEANGVDYASFKQTVIAALPYARVKWAGSLQQTNATGVWSVAIPQGLMTTGLSIIGPVVRTGGDYSCVAAVTGSVAAGFQVTLTFTKRKSSVLVPLPAVVIGAAATNVSVQLNETSAGVVIFDVGFAEPDVVGP